MGDFVLRALGSHGRAGSRRGAALGCVEDRLEAGGGWNEVTGKTLTGPESALEHWGEILSSSAHSAALPHLPHQTACSDSSSFAITEYYKQVPCLYAKSLSRIPLFETPWTVALQTSLSMGFSRQEYWSRLLCTPPGDHPDSGI